MLVRGSIFGMDTDKPDYRQDKLYILLLSGGGGGVYQFSFSSHKPGGGRYRKSGQPTEENPEPDITGLFAVMPGGFCCFIAGFILVEGAVRRTGLPGGEVRVKRKE
jgi:hypothetical protein